MKLVDPAPWVLAFLGVTALIWSLLAPWSTKTRRPRAAAAGRSEGAAAIARSSVRGGALLGRLHQRSRLPGHS